MREKRVTCSVITGNVEDTGDVEDTFESSLFDNESYELKSFPIGQQELTLWCSPSASTDYDLTGQTMWPAAQMLADFLAANVECLQGCSCACELGAGLGLVGLLAAQTCPVVMTDHNDVVLRVMNKNAVLNQAGHNIRCRKLEWASPDDIADLTHQSPEGKGYDILLGADVCYSLKALPILFKAASQLLTHKQASKFLLGYVSRAYIIDRQLVVEAQNAGFHIEQKMRDWQQLPGSLKGMVYELTWAEIS